MFKHHVTVKMVPIETGACQIDKNKRQVGQVFTVF